MIVKQVNTQDEQGEFEVKFLLTAVDNENNKNWY